MPETRVRKRAAPRLDKPAGTQSIQRAVSVLREIASNGEEGLRVVDIARRLELEPPTAHRIVKALVAEGLLLERDGKRRYHLGQTVYELGLSAATQFKLRDLFHPTLKALADETADVVFLMVRSHLDAVCIDRVDGSFPVKTFTLDVGGRRPLGVGAGSLALLAALPRSERDAVIAANASRLLKYGKMSVPTVRSALATVEKLGYAVNESIVIPGVAALGIAIHGPNGETVAAVSVSSISSRFIGPRRAKVVEMMKRSARSLERLLSGKS